MESYFPGKLALNMLYFIGYLYVISPAQVYSQYTIWGNYGPSAPGLLSALRNFLKDYYINTLYLTVNLHVVAIKLHAIFQSVGVRGPEGWIARFELHHERSSVYLHY